MEFLPSSCTQYKFIYPFIAGLNKSMRSVQAVTFIQSANSKLQALNLLSVQLSCIDKTITSTIFPSMKLIKKLEKSLILYFQIYIYSFVENSSLAVYCAVLYCAVLYCTVLCCAVLYCTVMFCTVLYCAAALYTAH